MESRALFREIHKNTWLKRASDSKVISKKADKFWVVFCVHGGTVALLEGYHEPKLAPSHNPEWSLSLQGALHVTHSLVSSVENEFEFVITLQHDVARFNAPTWDLMLEWVDTLRSKLREMKILSPRENVYSKLPEIRIPLLPTRDPTSPLPRPPPLPLTVPGIESPAAAAVVVLPPQHSTTTTTVAATEISPVIVMSNTSTQNIMNLLSNPLETYANTVVSVAEDDEDARNVAGGGGCGGGGMDTVEVTRSSDAAATTNITIIQVSAASSHANNAAETISNATEDWRSNVQIIPSSTTLTSSSSDRSAEIKITTNTSSPATVVLKNQVTKVQVSSNSNDYGVVFPSVFSTATADNHHQSQVTNISVGTESSSQHYEQVFLASTHTTASVTAAADQPSTSTALAQAPSRTPVVVQPNGRPQLNRGVTEISITRPSRSSARAAPLTRQHQPRAAENHAIDKMRCHEQQEQRRRSSSTSDMATDRQELRRALQQPPQPFRPSMHDAMQHQNGGGNRMTLREQQVANLRREIMHLGGVKLQLRRKDCVGSIGWVDLFGGVWVAGWKQKEHPVLYNALHIGDQLMSIAGTPIATAAEANKVIRSCQGLFVELIIRRVPFGRVYAIRREIEGQCLGLIRDGNTATIVDVVPNSLAARFGLPPKSKTVDGLNLTFWVLTEINSRPLNLFFKDNEIKDRLNSVGRDISILVQPSDLITKLKKQLKSLRGYKDFIVQ